MAVFTLEYETCESVRDAHVLVTLFEGQSEQRRLKSDAAIIAYKFSVQGLTQIQLQTYVAFYDARSGAYETFTWEDPLGATVTVRFVPETFIYRHDKGTYSLSWEFKVVN